MKLTKLYEQIILENILDSFKEKNVGDEKPLSNDVFNEIINVTKNKTNYILWLAKNVINKNILPEDIYKFGDRMEDGQQTNGYLSIFEKYKKRFPQQDINKYNTKVEIKNLINKCIEIRENSLNIVTSSDSKDNYVSTNDILRLKEVGIQFLGMKNSYQIFRVPNDVKDDDEAFKRYKDILGKCAGRDRGAKIDICTFVQDNFVQYLTEYGGDYYVLFNLGDTKSPYQFHAESQQFMDKNDEPLQMYTYEKRIDERFFEIISFIEQKMGYENNELIAKFLLSDPLEDGKFIDGTMNGKWQDTIQNDNSRELHHYTNDEGYYTVPHSVWVHNYKDGVKDGEQLRIRVHDENEKWDGTQQILEKQNYKNGQKHGKHLKYESGRLKVEELYDNNTKIEEIKYHDNGKVNKLTKYQNKPPYKEEFIYEDNGYLVWYSQEYKSGYSKVKEYNLGNLTREFMMVGGKKEGKEIEYYPNGNKKTIFTLINGQFSGLYETYYENGNLKTRGNIENDIFVDTFEAFYPSGNLKKRDYLQNGRPIKTENFEDK